MMLDRRDFLKLSGVLTVESALKFSTISSLLAGLDLFISSCSKPEKENGVLEEKGLKTPTYSRKVEEEGITYRIDYFEKNKENEKEGIEVYEKDRLIKRFVDCDGSGGLDDDPNDKVIVYLPNGKFKIYTVDSYTNEDGEVLTEDVENLGDTSTMLEWAFSRMAFQNLNIEYMEYWIDLYKFLENKS